MPGKRRGRRRGGRSVDDRKEAQDIDEGEGEAGETVVHVQCPYCRKLFQDRDGRCPQCGSDINAYVAKAPGKQAVLQDGLEPKYFSIYAFLALTVFTGFLFVYYIATPDTGEGGSSTLGFVLLPFAVFLVVLMLLMFLVMKRTRFTSGVRSKMIMAGLLGAFLSFLVAGVGKVGKYFVASSYEHEWLTDAEGVHNLFVVLALVSLIFLVGYFFLTTYRKRAGEQG